MGIEHDSANATNSTHRDFDVRVKPDANRNAVVKEEGAKLYAHVKVPPRNGSANKALICLLAKHFRVQETQIKIMSGKRGRLKKARILDS